MVDLTWQHLIQRNQVPMIATHVSLLQRRSLHMRQVLCINQPVLIVAHNTMDTWQLLVHLALAVVVDAHLVLGRSEVVQNVLHILILRHLVVRSHWAQALLVVLVAAFLVIRIDEIQIQLTWFHVLLHHGVSASHSRLDVVG